jgi:hypothetical protein
MPIGIDHSLAPRVVRITFSGPFPTLAELADVRQRIRAGPGWSPDSCALIDLRQVDNVPTFAELRLIMDDAAKDSAWVKRRAYLVQPGLQYGVARQSEVLAPTVMGIGVFIDESEALAWLGGDPAA